MRKFTHIFCILFCYFLSCSQAEEEAPLGLPIEIADIYIQGTEVEPIPRSDRSSALVVRIIEMKPAEDGFRYNISVYGLDPGTYQINDYLWYKDSQQKLSNTNSVILKVTNRHSLDQLPSPEEIEHKSAGKLGGYRTLMLVVAILWVVGLLLLVFYRKKDNSESTADEPPPTLHDKLQVLVASAAKGELDEQEQAKLERLIIGHWKTKIPELQSMSPAKALIKLRTHPEASPLILKLESWLHSPAANTDQKEVSNMLEPFREDIDQ